MKRILLALMVGFSTIAHAQMLEIIAPDTTGLGTGMICHAGDFQEIHFEKGRFTYDRPNFPRYDAAFIMMKDLHFQVVLEKGETLQAKIEKKGGKFHVTYKGKNSNASTFVNEQETLMARGWENIGVDEYDEEVVTPNKDFDFKAEQNRVNALYPRIIKLANSVKAPELRDSYIHTTNLILLSSRIALIDAEENMKGHDASKNHTPELEALLAQINPNDSATYAMGLTHRLIQSKQQHKASDQDFTAYTSEWMDLTNQYITQPALRRKAFNEIALYVFNTDMDNKTFDLDAFWKKYCQYAPKDLIAEHQAVIDSRRSTTAGEKCPDATFMDIDGNSHALSEFFGKGKYLYIDLWATWCIPCCQEIPYIMKHVAHYKNNDKIQFISISIDNNKEAWKRKLAKDKPEWQQFVTRNKAEYEKLSKDWGITGIPRFIIINPNGTINNSAAFRPSTPDFIQLMDEIIKK